MVTKTVFKNNETKTSVAIIDIGSNSVRLVIYENIIRAPAILFNEKVIGELGRGLEQTGYLNANSIDLVIKSLKRFKMLIYQVKCQQIHIFATSAVRDAKNKEYFLHQVFKIFNQKALLLSGKKEAYYSALGVLSSFYGPSGIVADLGGGSLELSIIDCEKIRRGRSYPLGGLRLKDKSEGKLSKAREIVTSFFKDDRFFSLFSANKIKNFYAIGGVWRSIGVLYMESKGYPLRIVHNFVVPLEDGRRFLQRIARGDVDHLKGIENIEKNRRYLLSYGAVVLLELLYLLNPKQIVFSSCGIREGYLYSLLSSKNRKKDPLLAFGHKMSDFYARSPKYAQELILWTEIALSALLIEETTAERRCREAVCLMSDIGWRAETDYRGTQAFDMIAYGSFVGVTHKERLLIALSIYYGSVTNFSDAHVVELTPLVGPFLQRKAKLLGLILRISLLFSAFHEGILSSIIWQREGERVALIVPDKFATLIGDRLEKTLLELGKILQIDIYFKIS